MEELGLVPSQLVNVLLLYAKPLGGFRPIGLLPSIIRLWEYCRKQVLWDWEKDNWRESNWAAPGRSSFTVVAHQRLAAEGAPDGHETAVALMDLVKAYELVPHHRILDGAIKFGFSVRVLRVVFAFFFACTSNLCGWVFFFQRHSRSFFHHYCGVGFWPVLFEDVVARHHRCVAGKLAAAAVVLVYR